MAQLVPLILFILLRVCSTPSLISSSMHQGTGPENNLQQRHRTAANQFLTRRGISTLKLVAGASSTFKSMSLLVLVQVDHHGIIPLVYDYVSCTMSLTARLCHTAFGAALPTKLSITLVVHVSRGVFAPGITIWHVREGCYHIPLLTRDPIGQLARIAKRICTPSLETPASGFASRDLLVNLTDQLLL